MELRCILSLFAAFLVGLAYAQLDEVAHMFKSQNSKKIYCGAHLGTTLSAVCKGNYNTLTKKTDLHQKNYWSQYGADVQSDIGYPFRSKASATSLLTQFRRRRRRRGVFNECCEKPCSHEELASYCGSTNRRK